MAGFSTTLENNVNLQLGSKAFGPFLIDDDVKFINITFDRDNWTNPAARLDVSLEISNNGDTFRYLAGFTASGGPPPPPPRANVSAVTVSLPAGTNRRIQGTYAVSGQRFRTTVTVAALL